MTRLDPIIAVKDIEASSRWYQKIFEFKNNHGGDHFAVLVSDPNEIMLCLHKWEEHNHPTMTDPGVTPGNGLLLYPALCEACSFAVIFCRLQRLMLTTMLQLLATQILRFYLLHNKS